MVELLAGLLKTVTFWIWYALLIVLFVAGVVFTIKTRGIQFRKLRFLLGSSSRYLTAKGGSGGIPAYQAFFTQVGTMLGSGTIFGVAIGIYLGGPGAIFWMWVYTLFGMAISMVECTLGQFYKVKSLSDQGKYIGGSSFYLKYGAKLPLLGFFFAFAIAFTTPIAVGLHSNFLSSYIYKGFGLSRQVAGFILAAGFTLVVLGGISRIAKACSYMVPFVACFYLGVCLLILIYNIGKLPAALMLIVQSAFGFASAGGGFVGWMFANAVNLGARRAMYSNGAGLGIGPALVSSGDSKHPAQGGFISMLSVFTDTIIFCTVTALVIITSGIDLTSDPAGSGGALLIDYALVAHLQLGNLPTYFMCTVMFFLVFTTMIGVYYFGESQLRYFLDEKRSVFVFRILHSLGVFYFAFMPTVVIVRMVDTLSALTAAVNLVGVFWLSKKGIELIKDYERQLDSGISHPEYKADWGVLKKKEIFHGGK